MPLEPTKQAELENLQCSYLGISSVRSPYYGDYLLITNHLDSIASNLTLILPLPLSLIREHACRIKHRRRTTPAQLNVLEAQFESNSKPDVVLRKQLAEQLDMTPREVQVWFQNRRAKTKK
ncbi:Homeodomain-like protein, partial [Melampsora americana]